MTDKNNKRELIPADQMALNFVTGGIGRWNIRRDGQGFAVAIRKDEIDVLRLVTGTTRNEACVEAVLKVLKGNEKP